MNLAAVGHDVARNPAFDQADGGGDAARVVSERLDGQDVMRHLLDGIDAALVPAAGVGSAPVCDEGEVAHPAPRRFQPAIRQRRLHHHHQRRAARLCFDQRPRGEAADLLVAGEQHPDLALGHLSQRLKRLDRVERDDVAGLHVKGAWPV